MSEWLAAENERESLLREEATFRTALDGKGAEPSGNDSATSLEARGNRSNFFKNSPTLAYLRRNRLAEWAGGPQIQENFLNLGDTTR